MHPSVSYPREADTPVSHLPFSPAVQVGNLVFVSGQASVDPTGKIVSDSFEGEFRRSVENLRKVLQSARSVTNSCTRALGNSGTSIALM